jgi:hypothetical protein
MLIQANSRLRNTRIELPGGEGDVESALSMVVCES